MIQDGIVFELISTVMEINSLRCNLSTITEIVFFFFLEPSIDMPAALANSLKADEEDRESDHTQVKKEEVVTHTTIETNLRQGHQAGCGLLVKEQPTARVDVPTAPRQYCYFLLNSLMSSLPGEHERRRPSWDRFLRHCLGSWPLRPSPVCTSPW